MCACPTAFQFTIQIHHPLEKSQTWWTTFLLWSQGYLYLLILENRVIIQYSILPFKYSVCPWIIYLTCFFLNANSSKRIVECKMNFLLLWHSWFKLKFYRLSIPVSQSNIKCSWKFSNKRCRNWHLMFCTSFLGYMTSSIFVVHFLSLVLPSIWLEYPINYWIDVTERIMISHLRIKVMWKITHGMRFSLFPGVILLSHYHFTLIHHTLLFSFTLD